MVREEDLPASEAGAQAGPTSKFYLQRGGGFWTSEGPTPQPGCLKPSSSVWRRGPAQRLLCFCTNEQCTLKTKTRVVLCDGSTKRLRRAVQFRSYQLNRTFPFPLRSRKNNRPFVRNTQLNNPCEELSAGSEGRARCFQNENQPIDA